jgi:hypothetical protein
MMATTGVMANKKGGKRYTTSELKRGNRAGRRADRKPPKSTNRAKGRKLT